MAGKLKRVHGVDAVRGLAIVLMVFSHGLNWFHLEGSHQVVSIGRLSLGDAATPLFFIIAGMALALSFGARRRRMVSAEHIAAGYRRRFQQLFVLGIPISFAWGVLQAQALLLGLLVLLALYVFEREGPVETFQWWPVVLGGGALVVHVVLGGGDELPSLLHLLLQGQFPMFALLGFMSVGFGVGRLLRDPQWPRRFVVLGGLFAAAAYATARIPSGGHAVRGWDALVRADMPLPFVLFGFAATLLLLSATELPGIRGSRPLRWLTRIGRYGLFLYLSHYVLILFFVVAFGWWQALDTPAAVAASVLLVAMTAFVGLHYRIDARTIYGWMDAWGRRWAVEPTRMLPGSDLDPSVALAAHASRVHRAMHTYGSTLDLPPR